MPDSARFTRTTLALATCLASATLACGGAGAGSTQTGGTDETQSADAGSDADTGGDGDGDFICTPEIETLRAEIFTPSCALPICHASADAAGGLDLQAADLAAELIGAPSGTCDGWIRVIPGAPDESLLYTKLAGPAPCGTLMPPTTELPPEQVVDPVGIVVIDPQGITRWYYRGGATGFPGATAIWAGVELLDDGSILAVRDGAVTIIDELGEPRLRYLSFDYGLPAFHHEVRMLSNGNMLTLCNSFEVVDYSSLGLDSEQLVAGDLLVELDAAGEIVWTWNAFDHLDPLRLRSDPGEGLAYYDRESGQLGYDWTHGNGMDESVDEDLILLSMRHQDWIIAIDHETGEVAWRFGEGGDFDLLDGTWFYHPHSPQLQPDGSLQPDPAAFDLGKNYSRLVEFRGEGEPSPIWSLTTNSGSYVYRATVIDRLPGEPSH